MELDALVLPLKAEARNFNLGVAGAIAGVTALVGVMSAAVKIGFDWASQLDSIQDVIGGTNEEAAALNFTLRKSGTSTETFNKSMVIMSKGLVKADGSLDTIGKSLQSWGIDVKDVNGKLKSQSQILSEAAKKYNSFGTQQERVNFLTETFGRGGAEMIDFFDTLANEGGIDAVTEKVNRFGLVIDPARYEKFTRSLEELKLVGVGLAVGFTESVMPAFERFLEIVTGPGTLLEKAGTLAANIDAYVGNFIGNLGVSIDNWVASGGPEQLSEKLIGWIENLGEGQAPRILLGAQKLVGSISNALSQVDWTGVGVAVNDKLTEVFENTDWTGAGEALGRFIDSDVFSFGFDDAINRFKTGTLPTSVTALLNGINEFFLAAVGANKFGGWDAYFKAWGEQIEGWFKSIYEKITAWVNNILAKINLTTNAGRNVTGGTSVPTTTVKSAGGRASGGPVIGGQTYFAHAQEIFTDGLFTAPSSGRVAPIDGQQSTQPALDESRLARMISTSMTQALIQAGIGR